MTKRSMSLIEANDQFEFFGLRGGAAEASMNKTTILVQYLDVEGNLHVRYQMSGVIGETTIPYDRALVMINEGIWRHVDE